MASSTASTAQGVTLVPNQICIHQSLCELEGHAVASRSCGSHGPRGKLARSIIKDSLNIRINDTCFLTFESIVQCYHVSITFDVTFKFSRDPGAIPVILAKLSTCSQPLRPYLPNCTECTRYRSSTGRFVNILLGPVQYQENLLK